MVEPTAGSGVKWTWPCLLPFCDLGWLPHPFWLAVPWYLNGGHGRTWGWHPANPPQGSVSGTPVSAPPPGSVAGRRSADASVVVTRWYVHVCSKQWGHSKRFRNGVSHSAWKGLVLHLQAVLQYSLFCLSWGFGGYINKTKQKRARKFKRKPRKYSEIDWVTSAPALVKLILSPGGAVGLGEGSGLCCPGCLSWSYFWSLPVASFASRVRLFTS